MKKIFFVMIFLSFQAFGAQKSKIDFVEQNGSCKIEFRASPDSGVEAPPFIYGSFEAFQKSNSINYKFEVSALKPYWKQYFVKEFQYLDNIEHEEIAKAEFETVCKNEASEKFVQNYEKINDTIFDCKTSKNKENSANFGKRIVKNYSSWQYYLFNNINTRNNNFKIFLETKDGKKASYNLDFSIRQDYEMGMNNYDQISAFENCQIKLIFKIIAKNSSIGEILNPVEEEDSLTDTKP